MLTVCTVISQKQHKSHSIYKYLQKSVNYLKSPGCLMKQWVLLHWRLDSHDRDALRDPASIRQLNQIISKLTSNSVSQFFYGRLVSTSVHESASVTCFLSKLRQIEASLQRLAQPLKTCYKMVYALLKSHIRICMYTSCHAYEHCTEFILNYVSGQRINSDFTKVTNKTSHISFDVITKCTRSNNQKREGKIKKFKYQYLIMVSENTVTFYHLTLW